MSKKVSITLDDDVLLFVDQRSDNRSNFINQLLLRERHKIFMQELEEAYLEDANDPIAKEERSLWEVTVGDGLNHLPDEDVC